MTITINSKGGNIEGRIKILWHCFAVVFSEHAEREREEYNSELSGK